MPDAKPREGAAMGERVPFGLGFNSLAAGATHAKTTLPSLGERRPLRRRGRTTLTWPYLGSG